MTTANQVRPSTTVTILDVRVNAQTFGGAISTLAAWANSTSTEKCYVCTCPVYTLMLCRENLRLRAAIDMADMVTADGMPIVWVQRWWGQSAAERVYGPDVMIELCRQTSGSDIRHFFLGGMPGVAEKLAEELTLRFPGLQVAGVYAPLIAEVGHEPDWALVERLNAAHAQVIWVGLGSPKQDIWMNLYRPYLNAPVLIGVGAAFDFLSGSKGQAPSWMRRSGLEWVFRLAQEPGRLWRRYLIYNPRFIVGVVRQFIRQRGS